MDRRPAFVNVVVIHADVASTQVDVRVQEDFEAVSVHPAALVSGGHVRQPMSRLETCGGGIQQSDWH